MAVRETGRPTGPCGWPSDSDDGRRDRAARPCRPGMGGPQGGTV
jgi:hypothetical protein